MELEERLHRVEQEFWKGDAEFYRENLTADCRMVFPGMGFSSREAAIRGVAEGQRWKSVEMTNAVVTEISDGSAILSYEADAVRGDENAPYRAWVASHYAKRESGWKLAFHQHTIAG